MTRDRRSLAATAFAACALGAATEPALAGMPSLTLTDLARLRLETISFFLVLLLVGALFIKLLWNGLCRDFARLPRLTYPRALILTVLWGLLFILVLTMISGARELMTPGAWEKNGVTYRLKSPPEREAFDAERLSRLAELKSALWAYARQHEGNFPADARAAGISPTVWQTPEASRIRYVYVPGRKPDAGRDVVAYEPAALPSPRFVLTSDGIIRKMSDAELQSAMGGATP